jgi:hypothetical protein
MKFMEDRKDGLMVGYRGGWKEVAEEDEDFDGGGRTDNKEMKGEYGAG